MINNNQTLFDQRTSGNDPVDMLNILGKRSKGKESMQTAHLCTVWAGNRQWVGKVSRQRGTDNVCMQMIDMQVYSNTYRCMCSNQSYQVGCIYRESRGVPASRQ